tara:strand:- start:49 stop:591 length:543 start_codon:yes stop_codon:yes gene_type:complete
MRHVHNNIGKAFERVDKDPETRVLKYPGHTASRLPIKSEGYGNCNGVVLLDNGTMIVSHYDLKTGTPESYIPELINETTITSSTDLSAVVIGGDTNHFERIKKILRKKRIPIVGEYCDGWMDEDRLKDQLLKETTIGHKFIVGIPNTKEVLIYSSPINYRRLTPKDKSDSRSQTQPVSTL